MTPWPATIIRNQDESGHFVLDPASPLKPGVEINVDLDSRSVRSFTVTKTGEKFSVEVVELIDSANASPKILFPVSMLDL